MHRRTRLTAGLAATATATLGLWGGPAAHAAPQPAATPSTQATSPSAQDGKGGRLDVLFVGAHPDDEAFTLSTFGQWHEYDGVRAGVITVTRGEGGGNAVGPEEGPPLGLLREAEERRAVGRAGITDVHNLDKVDFYYTVSEPLTGQIWDHQATLDKVVRIVRETRPRVIVTMNPAPVPGQHGNHQEAGRLAVEAFYAAADPTAFPDQITREHLAPWRVSRIFVGGAVGRAQTGPDCASTFVPADPTRDVFGVWSGRPSAANGGKTWAQVEREAQREYASQGWAVFPDVPTDPARLGCDMFTQIDSRVPFTAGNTSPDAMLEGALVPARGGLPLGTEFWLDTSAFGVSGGAPFTVTANVRAAAGHRLTGATVRLSTPDGWRVDGDGRVRGVTGGAGTATFTVTPPAGAAPGRVRLSATLGADQGTGTTDRAVEVRSPVVATPQLLPQVSDFEAWTRRVGVQQLSGSVTPVLTLGSGGSRDVRVDLANTTGQEQSGTVTLTLPAGFAADTASSPFGPIPPGGTGQVTFRVTNTDATLPTSNQGGAGGDYAYSITIATSGGATDTRSAALELVPVTTIPQAAQAPAVDGVESPGEYAGPALDLSRRWEGDNCTSAADCSGSAKVTWSGDDLYLVVHVTDDVLGTRLAADDCKRHWRTDSVEIALDPRGASENTSTTFKTGIMPVTADGGPCFERDADNRQGPGAETAPGMQVAATVSEPYTGYTLEVRIPLADLPAAVDPARFAMNLFIYDSDTQDKTGQTRIGWSTWGGVQGDPYRWGLATLPGYQPPVGRPAEPVAPVIPQTAARSVDSPQSILQAAATGVPLAGNPAAPVTDTAALAGPARFVGGSVSGVLAASGPGTAHVFVWDPAHGVLGSREVRVNGPGLVPLRVATSAAPGDGSALAVAFEAAVGGTRSSAVTLGG
jgi:LmbE family N-acetylglucosaminyl deacetylase